MFVSVRVCVSVRMCFPTSVCASMLFCIHACEHVCKWMKSELTKEGKLQMDSFSHLFENNIHDGNISIMLWLKCYYKQRFRNIHIKYNK